MTFSPFSDVITGRSVLSWLDQTYSLTLVPGPTNISKSNMNVSLTVRIPSFSYSHNNNCQRSHPFSVPFHSGDSSTTQSTCMPVMFRNVQTFQYLTRVIQSSRTDYTGAADVEDEWWFLLSGKYNTLREVRKNSIGSVIYMWETIQHVCPLTQCCLSAVEILVEIDKGLTFSTFSWSHMASFEHLLWNISFVIYWG